MNRGLLKRLLPDSLFGRTVLILLIGMLVSHAISIWVSSDARERAVRAIGGYAASQRIANLSRLIEEAPADWRTRIALALSDQTFRVALSSNAPDGVGGDERGAAAAIRDAIAGQLRDWDGRKIRVSVESPAFASRFPQGEIGSPHGSWNDMGPMGGMMRGMMGPAFEGGFGAWRSMQAAVRLSDGQWLTFATALPQSGPPFSWSFLVTFAVMGLLVLIVSAWAVRGVTAPIRIFAEAADRLGRDVAAPPLAETGASEIRAAAHAFNLMQSRVLRLVEGRTQMLAALSHDLRTPLTLLRLRTEEVENSEEREKMLATIGEMDSMITSTLAFARGEMLSEPRRRTDLSALVASIVDDMADAGVSVSMAPAAPLPVECQPSAIKRVVSNLIDNAVKYGERADVSIVRAPDFSEVAIEDVGPGIPADMMEKVFQPFYRIEDSRSRETGGVGLGLAISQSIAQAHGGQIVLRNKEGGGLRAALRLPA